MKLKAKYKNKTKMLVPSKVKDYDSLVSTIKIAFPQLPDTFTIFYRDSLDEQITLQDQNDYEAIPGEINPLVFTVLPKGQLENVSQIQPSKNRSNSNLADSVLEILGNNSTVQPPQPSSLAQNKQSAQFLNQLKQKPQTPIKEAKDQRVNIEDSIQPLGSKIDQKKHIVNIKKIQDLSNSSNLPSINNNQSMSGSNQDNSSSKQQPQVKKQQSPKVNRHVEHKIIPPSKIPTQSSLPSPEKQKAKQNKPISKVKCDSCKQDFFGSRWRCADPKCLDFDVCPKCYSENLHRAKDPHKLNDHRFIEIVDETFWTRINFAHHIKQILNPNYKQAYDENLLQVGEWISHEDIFNNEFNFVKQMWSKSPLTDKIIDGFQDWERQYEQQNRTK